MSRFPRCRECGEEVFMGNPCDTDALCDDCSSADDLSDLESEQELEHEFVCVNCGHGEDVDFSDIPCPDCGYSVANGPRSESHIGDGKDQCYKCGEFSWHKDGRCYFCDAYNGVKMRRSFF